jgi:GNAT superfamily N-acetyltransferase
MTDAAALLALYDAQLRGIAEVSAADVESDTDGPLVRTHYAYRGFVSYRSLDGVSDLDALIARQIAHFGARGEAFEWKTRGHDRPADLPDRLRAAGFVAEPTETVLVGITAELAVDPAPPPGVSLRQVDSATDFARIAAMESAVWGEDWSWLADELATRLNTEVFVAEADGEVVSAAMITYRDGTDFAFLFAGSTLAAHRRRGIYRALVALRAGRAAARGVPYLQVDASADSRPILQRLGFIVITTTTPYVWRPESPA